jgi:hypothetical protein
MSNRSTLNARLMIECTRLHEAELAGMYSERLPIQVYEYVKP